MTTPPPVEPGPVFRIDLAASVFGLTRRAIEGKIYRGDWVAGREYHRAPDGSIWLDKAGVQKWVVGGLASSLAPTASGSASRSRAKVASVTR